MEQSYLRAGLPYFYAMSAVRTMASCHAPKML
jgi:hypothetical protein